MIHITFQTSYTTYTIDDAYNKTSVLHTSLSFLIYYLKTILIRNLNFRSILLLLLLHTVQVVVLQIYIVIYQFINKYIIIDNYYGENT